MVKALLNFKFLILLIALTLLGLSLSKFNLMGPLYLFDFLLIVLLVLSFSVTNRKLLRTEALLPIGISIIYFISSLLISEAKIEYTIRQFSIFGYMIICYLIFNNISKNIHLNSYTKFIKYISIVSVTSQAIYVIVLLVTGFTNFSSSEAYYYLSPMVVMGIISFSAYALFFGKDVLTKTILFSLALILSLTVGHASAFLSVIVILLFYLLNRIKYSQRLIVAISVPVLLILFYFFLPQFSDNNATWRLLFWKSILKDLILNKFMLFGNGFGVPYANEEFVNHLLNLWGETSFIDEEERYLSPMHNSFLTIAFHIGIIPAFFILLPIFKFLKKTLTQKLENNDIEIFFGLCLVGLSIWVSLNVILELPHSSVYFWLVYFCLVKSQRIVEKS